MKRTIVTCVALLSAMLLTASFASADKPDKPDKPVNAKNQAAKQCAALKKADKAAFNSLYGPKKAMRNCIKGETEETQGEFKNAAKECKAEQAADPALFEETYGDDDPYTTTANAYGKCVSSKVKASEDEDTEVFQNAAKECKAERAADPEGFKATYGSAKSKGKNALGKCVSQKVKAAETV
jgi:hypothetical protein